MTTIKIEKITFDDVYPIWDQHLWPNRESAIEPTSALRWDGMIDMENMDQIPHFVGAYINDLLIGVNSLHQTTSNSFRSRGLYVFPEYRGVGVATMLLMETINIASINGAGFLWSIPRQTSWKTYEQVGFARYTEWSTDGVEFGPNAYAMKPLDNFTPISQPPLVLFQPTTTHPSP